jgi:hypothetical protein
MSALGAMGLAGGILLAVVGLIVVITIVAVRRGEAGLNERVKR